MDAKVPAEVPRRNPREFGSSRSGLRAKLWPIGTNAKKCEDIEAAVRQTVQHCERAGTARAALSRKINGEIKELMEKRRAAKLKTCHTSKRSKTSRSKSRNMCVKTFVSNAGNV